MARLGRSCRCSGFGHPEADQGNAGNLDITAQPIAATDSRMVEYIQRASSSSGAVMRTKASCSLACVAISANVARIASSWRRNHPFLKRKKQIPRITFGCERFAGRGDAGMGAVDDFRPAEPSGRHW